MVESLCQDFKYQQFGLVERPEQHKIKTIRKSRQMAAGSLQSRDTSMLFLPIRAPVSVHLPLLFCLAMSANA